MTLVLPSRWKLEENIRTKQSGRFRDRGAARQFRQARNACGILENHEPNIPSVGTEHHDLQGFGRLELCWGRWRESKQEITRDHQTQNGSTLHPGITLSQTGMEPHTGRFLRDRAQCRLSLGPKSCTHFTPS